MKNKSYRFLICFLFVMFSITSLAQNNDPLPSSTIYLVRTGKFAGSAVASYILFQNQQPFGLPVGGVIQYKIYSEGEISIGAQYSSGNTLYCNLNVKRGGVYYVYLNLGDFVEVSKEKVQKFLDVPEKNTKREENTDTPINKNSLTDLKKGGKGQGTCFLISSEGFFISNYHCVENAKEITIKGIDGDFSTKYGVTVIASDQSNDLVLLKVNNKNIKFKDPVFAIRSSGVAQAEKVFALGYPKAETMGQEIKVTDGIISAKSGVQGDISKFQISAAVNPGNSGGPLIDENGNLIGVIYAKSTVAEAAGYAIKAGYLETFLKNIDTFNYHALQNSIQNKSLPEKISELKNFIFIVETN